MTGSFVWLILFTFLNFSQCFNNTTEASINKKLICQVKTCIPKCCPDGYVVYRRKKCMPYTAHVLDFSDMAVFDEDATRQVSTVKEIMRLMPNKFSNENFKNSSFDLSVNSGMNLYLIETGEVYMERPNNFYRWTEIGSEEFCVDYMAKNMTVLTPRLWIQVTADPIHPKSFYLYEWLVPCVLLLGTLIIYPCSRQNGNLQGLMVMVFVFCLLMTFCLLFIVHESRFMAETCIALTKAIYFSYLSTFCWLTVLSFHRWYFPSHHRFTHSKWVILLAYGSFAWGVPGIMTYGFGKMNSADLRDMPWIITPNVPNSGCFLEGGEKFLYLDVPLIILLLWSAIFILMAYQQFKGIYAPVADHVFSTHSHSFDELPNRNKWQRFWMHVMNVAVMFLYMIFDIGKSLAPHYFQPLITTIYNIFTGVAIFSILIVFPKIVEIWKSGKFSTQPVQYSRDEVNMRILSTDSR